MWKPDPRHHNSWPSLGTGLKRLPLAEWLEIEPPDVFVEQMNFRRELLTGPQKDRFYVSLGDDQPDVRAAEKEALEMLLDHLEEYHKESFSVTRHFDSSSVRVHSTGETFQTKDYADFPLKLCALIVQEDFILLSPPEAGNQTFVAGAATFSFMEIGLQGEAGNMNVNKTIPFIHQTVPGFDVIGPKVCSFMRTLKAERPYYRTNWILVAEKGLNPMLYNLDTQRADGQYLCRPDDVDPSEASLRVECQSIRRLPRTRHILFSIHTYSNQLRTLAHAPGAASVLKRVVESLDGERIKYRGMNNAEWNSRVVSLLQQFAAKHL